MVLLVERRGVRGRRPRGPGAACCLPGLRPGDGVLVGLRALRASGPGPPRLGASGQVPAVPGDPRAAAVVFAAAALGCGRGDRGRAGAGVRWGRPAPGRWHPGGAPYHCPGLAAPVPGPRAGARRWPCGAGGGTGSACRQAGGRRRGRDARRAGGGVGLGPAPAGAGRARPLAAGRARQRRGLACQHHIPALGGAGWAGLDAARPVTSSPGGAMPPPPPPAGVPDPSKRAEAVALMRYRVVAEAANPRLSPAERGRIVRALAARAHEHPDGSLRTFSRGTLDRWIVAYRAGGLDGLRPVKRADAGVVRRHPELLAEAAALRAERPARSAAHIAEILRARYGIAVSERTIR